MAIKEGQRVFGDVLTPYGEILKNFETDGFSVEVSPTIGDKNFSFIGIRKVRVGSSHEDRFIATSLMVILKRTSADTYACGNTFEETTTDIRKAIPIAVGIKTLSVKGARWQIDLSTGEEEAIEAFIEYAVPVYSQYLFFDYVEMPWIAFEIKSMPRLSDVLMFFGQLDKFDFIGESCGLPIVAFQPHPSKAKAEDRFMAVVKASENHPGDFTVLILGYERREASGVPWCNLFDDSVSEELDERAMKASKYASEELSLHENKLDGIAVEPGTLTQVADGVYFLIEAGDTGHSTVMLFARNEDDTAWVNEYGIEFKDPDLAGPVAHFRFVDPGHQRSELSLAANCTPSVAVRVAAAFAAVVRCIVESADELNNEVE